MGTLAKLNGGLFLPSGGTDESKLQALDLIKNRQEEIETEGKYAPIYMYPEGSNSNGSHLLTFKKGAFISLKRCTPMVIQSKTTGTLIPSYDSIPLLSLVIFQCCWGFMPVKLKVLPDFEPNEFFFEKFSDKGSEPWEIYAWAIRDIMAKSGNLKLCEISYKERDQYQGFMHGKRKYTTPYYQQPHASQEQALDEDNRPAIVEDIENQNEVE